MLFVSVFIIKVQNFVLLVIALAGGVPCFPAYAISVTVVRKSKFSSLKSKETFKASSLFIAYDAALCIGESILFGLIFFPLFRANDHVRQRLESPASVATLNTIGTSASSDTIATLGNI